MLKTKNIISSSSSSGNSSHNSKSVENVVRSFDRTTIKTCVIGISSILISTKTFTHAALFLSDKEAKIFDKDDEIEGIILEYGKYIPNNSEKEIKAVNNGYVIYRYGDYYGGLRYYVNVFEKFKEIFGDVIYITLEVSKYNQISFSYLLNKIAPKYDYKWVHEKYRIDNFNCRTFVAHALNEIKPIYDSRYISKGKHTLNTSEEGEYYVPKEILKVLKEFKDY